MKTMVALIAVFGVAALSISLPARGDDKDDKSNRSTAVNPSRDPVPKKAEGKDDTIRPIQPLEIKIVNNAKDTISVAVAYKKGKDGSTVDGWYNVKETQICTSKTTSECDLYFRIEMNGKEVLFTDHKEFMTCEAISKRFEVAPDKMEPSTRVLKWGDSLEHSQALKKGEVLPEEWTERRFFRAGTKGVTFEVPSFAGRGNNGVVINNIGLVETDKTIEITSYNGRPLINVANSGNVTIDGVRIGVGNVIVGSGKGETKTYALADFTGVEVSSAFKVDIVQGEKFGVSVTTDDNLFKFVKIVKDGSALKISLDPDGNALHLTQLRASITMPELRAVTLSGETQGTIKGFKSTKDFEATVAGASTLSGDIEARNAQVKATGESTVELTGTGTGGTWSATGASTLKMSLYKLKKADIILTGASTASVNASAELSYTLTGASHLKYSGSPEIKRAVATGASSASKE